MKHHELNISSALGVNNWQTIQDQLAEASRLAIITVDFRGVPVTVHSKCHKFCDEMRANPITKRECYKCDAHGGIEASRINKPYMYLCHCNIVDVAIPVIVNEKYLGAVMVGQVILEGSPGVTLEKVFGTLEQAGLSDSSMKMQFVKNLEELPRMRYDTIRMLTDIMAVMIKNIVDRNVEEYDNEMLENNMNSNKSLSLETMMRMRDEINYSIIEHSFNMPNEPQITNQKMKYALDYLRQHKSENISLTHMASMCSLSNSYFSRLFSSEIGCSYSSYVTGMKIQWAKQCLKDTSDSIAKIAEMLGFVDAGYFIKVFHRYVGVTPAVYRRENK